MAVPLSGVKPWGQLSGVSLPFILPTVDVNGKLYYVDAGKNELREIYNPSGVIAVNPSEVQNYLNLARKQATGSWK